MVKKLKYSRLVPGIVLLAAVFFSVAAFIPADNPIAIITKVVKDVDYKTSEADWNKADIGVGLKNNDEVKTGLRSLALVKFLDGSLLRVRENSVMQIYGEKNKDRLGKNTFIQNGKVGFEVTEQQNQEFIFTTPTGVASIRGTGGFIEVPEDGSTLLVVESGSVELNATVGVKESGTVSAGNTGYINTSGEVKVEPSTDDQQKEMNKTKKVETKTIKIYTREGVVEIEYLPED